MSKRKIDRCRNAGDFQPHFEDMVECLWWKGKIFPASLINASRFAVKSDCAKCKCFEERE